MDQLNSRWRTSVAGKRHALDRLLAVIDIFNDYYSNPVVPGGCPIGYGTGIRLRRVARCIANNQKCKNVTVILLFSWRRGTIKYLARS